MFGNTTNIPQSPPSNDTQKMPTPPPPIVPSAHTAIENCTSYRLGTNRINDRDYPIPPTDYDDVFLTENLFMLAINAQAAGQTSEPRATDVRAFLRRELETAYDIVSQLYRDNDPESFQIRQAFEDGVEKIARSIRGQDYRQLADLYQDLANNLPGKLNAGRDGHRDSINNPLNNVLTILCYAIAVESGLLDEQLRLDMKRVLGKGGVNCAEIDTMRFYPRSTPPEVQAKFQEYVVKRWPLITFALDPQVDQQNIDDVTNVSRDLQLALSFAFSTGQIGFNQLITFQRQLTFAAEAIALNRTVTSFAHGDDTFGFRFMPRYQTPPQESTNFSVIANLLVKGGPGRNYQMKNSKLEAGQRELTAIVIMPSFLQGIEMDVTGNWFPLHDPDQMKTPTPRMIEQGRKVVELREALACIHDHKSYRPGDIRRLETRVHQLEVMLPMQTHEVRVPYENTLGGFQLFQEGTTSLVPHLDGFQGADSIAQGQETDLVIFGKHFSVQETRVVIGGSSLLPVELDPSASSQQSGQSAGSGNSAAPAASQTSQSTSTGNATTPTVTQTTTKQTAQSPSTGVSTGASPSPAATPAGNPNVDVISREVLRISIPSGIQATNILDADGKTRPYVEVYVATPNGISNRLLIPYKPTATATPATPPGYTVSNNLALVYKAEVSFGGKNVEFIPPLTYEPQLQDNSLLIGLASDSGIVPASIKAVFKMTLPNGKDSEPITISNIPYVAGSQGYLINDVAGKMNFTALANGISGLKEFNQFFPVTSPNAALTTGLTPTLTATLTAKVTLTPENMPGNIAIGGDQAASNALTINVTINVLSPVPAPPKPGAGGGAGNARNLALPPLSSARPRSVAPMARVQESGRDAALSRSTYRPSATAALPPLPAMPPAPATSKQASPKRAAAAPVDDKEATKGGRWPWSKR